MTADANAAPPDHPDFIDEEGYHLIRFQCAKHPQGCEATWYEPDYQVNTEPLRSCPICGLDYSDDR